LSNVSFNSVIVPYHGFDFQISYFIRSGQTETIVYLHGLGSTKYDFFEAVNQPGLSDFTIVAIDFPGSGNSKYLEGLAVDDLVELTNQVISTLQLTDLNLIGHSMGGLVALLFAGKYADRVRRLVSIEGNLAPEDCGILSRPTAALSFDHFVERDFMKTFQEKYAGLPYVGARVFADTFRKNVSVRAFHDYCVSIVAHSDSGLLLPLFAKLEIPRLFIYGSANSNLSYAPQLDSYGVSVVEVPDSHHWPHIDNPAFYYQAIQDFLLNNYVA
jgi:pimeloyl-ACP methyl ester carboxylesterase